ncbi:replicative helicase loader/inhibitor [Virgibacillus sp. 179-BFC.A HS]|uniref:Replicative helicase loader/inhibitor n=1 Tax=Tigheibacillus jepli TaxID=3035914 RepID=A0ABU5CD15_9BACI|nr:replicative helicase loader/inhibitor [Virgibacillus sp. 179-BFC.A HS]MDY0404218.1 replicative helicase loader/inhibitor [Virgibacillus sp. 179-BFC.A HS]
MTRNEAIRVLETIKEIYPKFEISNTKAKMLLPKLEEMDFEGVLQKLAAYVATHPYPPTIQEIAAYLPTNDNRLQQIDSWRKEAACVSPTTKRHFRQKLYQLLQEKCHE